MTADPLSLLRSVDLLFEGVVTSPAAWPDEALASWAEEAVASEPAEKTVVRPLNRCLRAARKLRDFWATPPPGVLDASVGWRSRVDIALGSRAWRPTLDLAVAGLDAAPSAELFEEVRARFRVVNSELWMEGVTFDEWVHRERGCTPNS